MVKAAFVFPGQGSQVVGMGRDLYDAYDWAKELFDQADQITGKPISRLCFEGPLEELTLTVNLQPAVTVVNLACFRALTERGLKPAVTAGHSLGEYSALCAAGVFGVEETLALVNERGELMHRDAQARTGAMQAIMGLTIEEVAGIVELAGDRGLVSVANHNTPQQIVITGESTAVAMAAKLAQTKKAKTVALPVSGAWHSPLMEAAGRDFAEKLGAATFNTPSAPVVLNVSGRAETDPEAIREAMIRQMTSPVKWCDSVLGMVDSGVDAFVEVGPKNVLAGLVRKTVPRDKEIIVVNVQDLAGADQALEKIGS